jgi:hypothetical protein
LPPDATPDLADFFFPAERRRLVTPYRERFAKAFAAADERRGITFAEGTQRYLGRRVTTLIPGADFRANTGRQRIRVEVGVREEFLDQLRNGEREPFDHLDDLAKDYLVGGIKVHSEDKRIVITDGSLFLANMELV